MARPRCWWWVARALGSLGLGGLALGSLGLGGLALGGLGPAGCTPAPAPVSGQLRREAVATPQRFLRWYQPRQARLLYLYAGPGPADRVPATAPRPAGPELYLRELATSQYLSGTYLRREQTRLGRPPRLPAGFDPVTYSKPWQLASLARQQPRLLACTPDSARVELLALDADDGQQRYLAWLRFDLSRHRAGWVIDGIERRAASQCSSP